MTQPYFQNLFAERIGGVRYGETTEIYKFEKIKRAKRNALDAHPNRALIDLGVGENDEMAPLHVREKLWEEANRVENRGYADNGINEFKYAVADFMSRNFGVELDAETEVNHSIGSKPALAMLPGAFINPGDVTFITVPGYPVAGTHTAYYGGERYALPLLPENNFLPDLDSIPADIRARAKLLVLNYPNSPTGAIAPVEFFKQAIEFARENQLVVANDAAHSLLSFAQEPLSFLSVEGAREVGVELHSLSKGFNMIGWRIGWVCGHERIVNAIADIKDNSDSGQFIPIQKAAALALSDDSIHQEVRSKYQRRLRKLVGVLKDVGFDCEMPGGTYFLYARCPKSTSDGVTFSSAEDAARYLIEEQGVVTVPWDDAGAYLRFSATYIADDETAEDALMAELRERLASVKLQF